MCVRLSLAVLRAAAASVGMRPSVVVMADCLARPFFPPGGINASYATRATSPLRPLRNTGNECYMNAAIHALFASHRVREAVELAQVQDGAGSELQQLISRTLEMCRGCHRDTVHVTCLSDRFYDGSQQDAHEFLQKLCDPGSAEVVPQVLQGEFSIDIKCATENCDGRRSMVETPSSEMKSSLA